MTLNTSDLCKGAASVSVNVTVGRQASFEGPVATSLLAIVQFPAELVNQGAAPPNGQLLGFEKVLLPSANDKSAVAIELDVRHFARPIGPVDVAGILPGGVVSPGVYPVRVGAPGMWQDGTIELVGSACGATQAAMPW